jgi:hypothetical protein
VIFGLKIIKNAWWPPSVFLMKEKQEPKKMFLHNYIGCRKAWQLPNAFVH